VLPPEACTTPFSQARQAMQAHYLAEIAARFAAPALHIPLLPYEVKGLDVLIELGERIYGDGSNVPQELLAAEEVLC
jgi:hypothetical protein